MTKPRVGTNRYSYSFNDLVKGLDPHGNEVLIVAGTDNDENDENYWENSEWLRSVEETFPGEEIVIVGNYGMENEINHRTIAATQIGREVRAVPDGNKVIIIAHSHGVNATKEYASQQGSRPIDILIGPGGPLRDDYTLPGDGSVVQYYNVYSNSDGVAPYGGTDGGKMGARFSGVSAQLQDSQANLNIDASTVQVMIAGRNGSNDHLRRFPVMHGFSRARDPAGALGPIAINGPLVWQQHVAPVFR